MLGPLLALPLLAFHGNVAMVEDVYRSVLDLPPGTRANPSTAHAVMLRLGKFLHNAGYSLATVRARVEGDQVVVDIDEGRLDKVIFLGGGAFETLRLRLDLNLHEDVFNRYELERQLKALAAKLGLAEFAYEVVPVADVRPPRVQLDDLEPLEELSQGLVRPGRPYELHILVQPGVFRPGVSPELEIDSLEGGGLGATYHSGRLLFRDDRFQLGGRIAGALRQRLDETGSYFSFTRALGEAEYDAPPIAGVLRPSILGRADLFDRQRPDLRLESFRFSTLQGQVQLLLLPIPGIRASVGAGVERRLLFNTEPQTGTTPVQGPQYSIAQNRMYAEAGLQLTFDPQSLRRDRHHQLGMSARVYSPPHTGVDSSLHLDARYQKMFARGWNELWIETRGLSRSGNVLFPEEESIGGGDLLRGPFGAVYARRLVGLDLEYRFSLLRDVFKLGIFHNAVGYGAIDRATNKDKLAGANAVGLSLHALIIDEFQLDAWFGVGWSTGGAFSTGAALAIRQAF